MTIFATELAEGLNLPLPDTAKPLLSLEPYFAESWGPSGLGAFVGPFMDVARDMSQLVTKPLEFAAELAKVMDMIPAETIPFVGSVLSMGFGAFKGKHEQNVRESVFGLALGIGDLTQLGKSPVPAWADKVSVPSFIDCTKSTNARARTVVPPQKMPAPWRSPGSYPQPSGNCGQGYAVWCNFDHYPYGKKKPNAGGKRCSGKADVSALLYPFWTGSRPPGPAPAFFPQNASERNYFGVLDTNADMLAAQAYYLGTRYGNFSVRIADVVRMRNNLQAKVGKYIEMQVADPAQNYVLTDERLSVAITMCDAFIAARAAFVQSAKGQDFLHTYRGGDIDPDATSEALALRGSSGARPPGTTTTRPGGTSAPSESKDKPLGTHEMYAAPYEPPPTGTYVPDLSAYIEAENPGSGGGAGAIMLLAAGGLIYTLTRSK